MAVRSVDLRAQYFSIRVEIDEAITRVLNRALFIGGEEVALFEREFAAFCKVNEAVGVASGAEAIKLALIACGIGPGDEVVTTPLNFVSTVEAICHVGAKPVFVDVAKGTLNLDPSKIEEAINGHTKALIPAHLYGYPAEIGPIMEIASKHNIKVIEDVVQGHGAEYRGQHIGTFGHVGCFSFHPSSNLGAFGEAGMVVTNIPEVAERVRLLRNHGQKDYEHLCVGFDSRMDALQAAVLRVKLSRLDEWNERRRSIASQYRKLLNSHSVELPPESPDTRPSYHQFVIRTQRRGHLRRVLNSAGIDARYDLRIPIHLQTAYRHLGYQVGDFPAAERVAQEAICLPIYPELTDGQVCEVASLFNRVAPELLDIQSSQLASAQ